MQPIKAVAFDLEGTTINLESAHHQAQICAALDVGVKLTMDDCFRMLPHFIGGPDEEVAKEIAAVAEMHSVRRDYRDILESDKNYYNQLLKELKIELRKGFLDFFYEAKERGLRYTIGSLTKQEPAQLLLEKSGLLELFGTGNIVLREHVRRPKPAPDVWLETARRSGVDPSSQLVFDDSPRGIEGAAAIGAYCIGMPVYNRQDALAALVNAGARRIFLEWDEIKPGQLLDNIDRERRQQ